MGYENGKAAGFISESHEERIQRLEVSGQTTHGLAREHSVKIDMLTEKLSDFGDRLGDKLEILGSKMDSISDKVDPLARRVEELEKTEAKRMANWSVVKKTVFGLTLTGMGALVKTVFPNIYHFFAGQ